MKSFILLNLIFSLQAMATTQSYEFTCEGPGIHYVNQFEMKATLDFNDEILENVNLTAQVRKAGFDSTVETIELENLSVKVERIFKPEIFGKAFHMIQIKSEKEAEQKVFASIVLGYPGKLTSFLRLEGLRQYKSTCKLAE